MPLLHRVVHPGPIVALASILALAACGGPEVRAVSATPATFTTAEDAALEGTLHGTGPEGATLAFRSVTQPAHGTLELQPSGAFRYTPEADFVGQDLFTFDVDDGNSSSDPAEVVITVTPVEDMPRIVGQQALSTPEDTPLTLSLASVEAMDPDGPLSPALRLVVEEGQNYTHAGTTVTPAANFFGSLVVQVRVEDETGRSDPYPLRVEVTPVDDPPVVAGQATTLTTPEDTPLPLTTAVLVVTDVDDLPSALTIEVLPGPNHTWSNGVLTPAQDFHGTLILDVEVSDGKLKTPAQLEVTVTPVNDPPFVSGQAHALSTAEDTPIALSIDDVVVSDVDSPAGSLSFAVQDGPGYSHVGNTVTPAPDFNGDLLVLITVADAEDQSPPFSLLVTVVPVNDPPVITAQAHPISTPEDTAFTVTLGDLTVVDVDHPQSALSVQVLDGTGYTYAGNVVSPAPDYTGPLTVMVVSSDGTATSQPFALQVTVTPVNDPPVITAQARALSTDEDTPLALSLADVTASDVDSTSLSLVVLDGTNYSHSGTSITPAADFNGTLQVNVAVSDGQALSAPFTLHVTVNPVNDPPVITAQARALSILEDTSITLSLADVTVQDVDSTSLTLTVLAGANYTSSGNVVTPAQDYNGTLRVGVVVSDGLAQSAPFEVAITVGPVNDAPVITGQARAITTPEDTPYTITLADLIVVDADHPASALTVLVQGGPNYTVSGATVTPAQDFYGTLQIPVRVNDGEDSSAVFNLTATVTSVNDVPQIVGQVALITYEEVPVILTASDFTIVDPDNVWPRDFTVQVLPGANYTVSGSAVTPNVDFSGTLSVQVTVSDGRDTSPIYLAQIIVRPVNKPPQAVDDAFRTSANTELTVAAAAGVLANDSDRESTVQVTNFDAISRQGGSVQVSPDGSLLFRPKAGFVGADSFHYTITEGVGGQTATATVSVTVVGPAIWYVNNAVATSGDGRSHAPFKQLSQAATVSGNGDVLFIYRGDGTSYGNVVLKPDQALVGEGAGLTRPENPPIPPGARPVLGAGNGIAVTLASRNQVRGLDVSNGGGSGIVGTAISSVALAGMSVSSATDGIVLVGTGPAQARVEAVVVSTTAGRALSASGFGSLIIPDSQVSLTAQGGPALELLSIGSLDATFKSLTSNRSASSGLRLDSVGGTFLVQQPVSITRAATDGMSVRTSSGTVTVARLDVQEGTRGLVVDGFNGTFTVGPSTGAAGAGGTIQSTTGEGVLLANASGITLRRLAVQNTGADGLRVPDGAKVTNLSVLDSLFFQAGNASTEHALNFGRGVGTGTAQLDGTALVQNTTLEASGGGGLFLENGGGTLNLTLDGLSVQGTGTGSSGVLIRADASRPGARPQMTLDVRASSFSGIPVSANGLDVATEGGAAILTATVEDNLFHNTVGGGNNALRLSADGVGATLTAYVRRNSARNWNGHVFLLQSGDQNADLRATVEGNTLGDGSNASVVGSANGSGIKVLLDADPGGTSASGRVALRNNVISRTGISGIEILARQGLVLANNRLDVILENNRSTASASDAVRLTVSESTTLCAAVSGNTLAPGPGAYALSLQQRAPASFLVQGVSASPTPSTVQGHLASTNTASPVFVTGTYQSTSACLSP